MIIDDETVWLMPASDTREMLQEMVEEYYSLRGWDRDGVPERATLERLGLAGFMAKDNLLDYSKKMQKGFSE